MLIFLVVVALLMGIIASKNRGCACIVGFIMWITFAFNTNNPDYSVYKLIFQGYYADSVEPGFLALNNLAASCGVPFQVFFASLATFSLACLFIAWKKWNGKLNGYSLSLLLLYPFFSMITTVRWTVAACFTVLAITIYCKSKRCVRDKIIYLIMLLLSGSFHYSMLIFIFIICVRPAKQSRELILKIGLIASCSAIMFLTDIPTMIISRLIGTKKNNGLVF